MKITYREEELDLKVERYQANNSPAITLFAEDGEPHTTITVCDEQVFLLPTEILVKTWSENSHVVELADDKLFTDTGKRISNGFVEYQIWEVANEELMLEIVKGY